ncbi:serine O-acetyltransferase [Pseudoxanthomonas taiwanensis]|uniref:serine O-acetyltransferase n=1 Tax=Pseudoxanthomonas taiwanensis TaxID=176598 RepID=UPI0011BF71F6|nr:DapH/DapD/GlmU-related protein [Pseudoxanthomonas taiwanensis]
MISLHRDLVANGFQPSALGLVRALILSPGFLTVALYRFSYALYGKGSVASLISKVAWRINVALSGCYISPKAIVGPGLGLPHPTGIVIGDGVVIGERVTIYQGVTLGVSGRGTKEYPHIGNDVVIYADAVLLGGVHIGDKAKVGAKSLVLSDVAPSTTVVGCPARPVHVEQTR